MNLCVFHYRKVGMKNGEGWRDGEVEEEKEHALLSMCW